MTHSNLLGYCEFVIEDTLGFRDFRLVGKGEKNERGV
jgi:hypothetical protein